MIVRDQHARHAAAPDAWLRALLLVAFFMLLPHALAQADERGPLQLTGPAQIAELSAHFDYILDPQWQLTVEDVTGTNAVAMQPVTGALPDFGYTTAKVWLRLPVLNATASVSDWRFHVHVAFLQQLAVYRVGADGAVTTLVDLTDLSPFGARPIDYPQVVAPFQLAPGESAAIIVAYQSMGASRHAMSIETPDSFAAKAREASAKNYAFYGMMLVMIALATVALVTLREPVFAAYAAYFASIFLYIAHADGVAFQVLWPNAPQLNGMAASLAGSGVMVFGGLFAITFLQTARYHPIMHRVLIVVVGTVLSLDIVLWAINPALLNRVLVYLVLVSVGTFVAAGIVAARTRFREVRFYLLSWSAALIPAVLFTSRFAFGFSPSFITTYDAIRLALVLDALLMGLAIFDRYNHLRQAALAETLAHAQRNLALSQRLAALEEQYEEVIANARQREESVKDTVHDLRQPMHALRLSLRQMLSGEADRATDANQIDAALGYMETLVAERLASAAPPPSEARPDDEPGIHGVLQGVVDMFGPEAAAKGLGLSLKLGAPDAATASYPLMRVVANLVSNAIKYTPSGRVLISLRRHGSGHRIEVHDTGPGLRGAQFEHALVRNERLERDRGAADGTGLGLSVVTETAAANGWTLSSCAQRRTGASIRLDIPMAVTPV